MDTGRGLSLKQRRFLDAYLGEANGNATRAYRLAGYKGTPGTSAVEGHRLLRNPKIREEIDRRTAEDAMRSNEVLFRLSEMARASIGDFLSFDDGGAFKFDLAPARKSGKLRLIRELDLGPSGVVKLRLHDSLKALTTLAKIHGLLSEPGARPTDPAPVDPAAAERALKAANGSIEG